MRIFVRGPPSKEEFRFVSWWKLRGRKEGWDERDKGVENGDLGFGMIPGGAGFGLCLYSFFGREDRRMCARWRTTEGGEMFIYEGAGIYAFFRTRLDRHCANICYCIRVLEEKASKAFRLDILVRDF